MRIPDAKVALTILLALGLSMFAPDFSVPMTIIAAFGLFDRLYGASIAARSWR